MWELLTENAARNELCSDADKALQLPEVTEGEFPFISCTFLKTRGLNRGDTPHLTFSQTEK